MLWSQTQPENVGEYTRFVNVDTYVVFSSEFWPALPPQECFFNLFWIVNSWFRWMNTSDNKDRCIKHKNRMKLLWPPISSRIGISSTVLVTMLQTRPHCSILMGYDFGHFLLLKVVPIILISMQDLWPIKKHKGADFILHSTIACQTITLRPVFLVKMDFLLD